MASIDLLEELNLRDYYPQQLSFSEAIKLRGKSENGCQEQYGLEIVRKLLMFDSKAVDSVTSEIIKCLNNTGNKETETKDQSVVVGIRPPCETNVRPSWKSDSAEQNGKKINPMDLLVVVLNCCDDFLRQVLVEKMVANKLSIPILLPDLKNGSYTLLLLALRSLVPEVQNIIRESSYSLTDTLVDIKNPVVSFIRVGNLHRSKSKLVNDLLNLNSFNTFFHRNCPNGSAKRLVSNGSIEAAWFQSSTATEKEFNCSLFTALNLRGDARDYPKQTQFLCKSSTLTVFMVESFASFKELYENIRKDADMSQTKIIVCYISSESPDNVDDKYFEFLDDLEEHGVISAVKYDWCDSTKKMTDVDFANDLRKTLFESSRAQHGCSNKMLTYSNFIQSGKKFDFLLDEDKLEYELGKASVDEFVELILDQPPNCKPKILPLQGEPWKQLGKLEREQRGKSQEKSQDAYFIAEKETEKRRQREIQCRSLIRHNEIPHTFSLKFHRLQKQDLSYYLNSCKIKLDARSRLMVANIMEEYEKEQEHNQKQSNGEKSEVKLSQMELKIVNSAIGLEHILRECGQMYEAVSSEEIRMKEELKNALLPPDVIRNFPVIVARLLLKGQPLELMDGDASNVPITWLKAVLDQIDIITDNAKVFVLSIIGVQSSGKSTLLNALFGLQFPVSAGRCTKGIYCHLVPVDKRSLHTEHDYVLVMDTEGLSSSQIAEKSIFRDNELATFAIGLADATIINMKGENWAEMKDILQIVAYGLIRVRKTKAELGLMPRCMFVHQNVAATDAEERNRLGEEKQLMLLDEAIKAAALAEGITGITKFNQVIKYDHQLHAWYFPDFWNGRPPKARISQDYIGKANELRQYLMQLMKDSHSKLTISSFFHRMSDLWNAMLHNDFVLCFRNTQEIIAGTFLNDRIFHEVDNFKSLNKLEQIKINEFVCSFFNIAELREEKDRILIEVSAAVEKNFTNMKVTLQDVIDATDICAALRKKYEMSLTEIKGVELRRIKDVTENVFSVHMKKLEIGSDQRVKDLKTRLTHLEKRTEEGEKDKLKEIGLKEFEASWQHLIGDNKRLVDSRRNCREDKIKKTIRDFTSKLIAEKKMLMVDWENIFKTTLIVEMPQVTENDIVHSKETSLLDFVLAKSPIVCKANRSLVDARKKWDLQFENQRGHEFDVSHLKEVTIEVGQLLGFSRKQHEVPAETDEICFILPPGYRFKEDYTMRFFKFLCHYEYNRSLENSKIFISLTDPLADISDRQRKSISRYRLMSAEANIDAVSENIFDYAKSSFIRNLDQLIKTEVCREDNKNPTFLTKRDFLRTILTDLGQRTHNLTDVHEEKEKLFKEFMLYVEMAESETSENFFLDIILKLLKEMLATENESETDFQKMVKNNVGKVVEKAKTALTYAETMCKGCAREYVRIFKEYMNASSEIDSIINNLNDFTKAVLETIDNLYADFLCQANSSFETLVCEENKAAIRPLFEKIMGCREKCPFCSAPCSQSLHQHAGDHRANHYPTGVRGTVECPHWLGDIIQETNDATEERRRQPRKLALQACQALVGTGVDIRTKATVQKFTKWYHLLFNWNFQSFRKYKEIEEYKSWDIPQSQDSKDSLYWKWFMAQFATELAEHYKALRPEIPEAWQNVTWEEAKGALMSMT